VTAAGGWAGGQAIWLGTALQPDSPFNTPWRRVRGGLWDLAPHVISLLWASLGPVTAVTAEAGPADVTHLILHHADGASAAVTVSLSAPESAAVSRLELWGPAGRWTAPVETGKPIAPLRTALAELAASAKSGQLSHPCDVQFGRAVNQVLASAQGQLDARR
jgi:predicted dehydrogenase